MDDSTGNDVVTMVTDEPAEPVTTSASEPVPEKANQQSTTEDGSKRPLGSRADDGEVRQLKKQKVTRAQKITKTSTIHEIMELEPDRKLGLFLSEGVVRLEMAGMDNPEKRAPAKEKARWRAAIVEAVAAIRKRYPLETWWHDLVFQLEVYAGVRRTKDDLTLDISALLHGTRLEYLNGEEEEEEEEEERRSQSESATLSTLTPAKALVRSVGLAVKPRKAKTFSPQPNPGAKTGRKSNADRYPTLPREHPNYQIPFDMDKLIKIIERYPPDRRGSKQERHKHAPNYFDNRGFLRQGNPLARQLIEDWCERAKPLLDRKQEDPNFRWPEDLWTWEYFKPLLDEPVNIVGQLLSKNLLNAHGRPRQRTFRSVIEGYGADGKFIPVAGDLSTMGTNALVAKALDQNIKSGQKDPKQRIDLTRGALNTAALKLAKEKVEVDKTVLLTQAAVWESVKSEQAKGMAPARVLQGQLKTIALMSEEQEAYVD